MPASDNRGDAPHLPPLRDVIAAYGLNARKQLGQHFLLDINLTRRIARSAGEIAAGTTIEIGPGPGGLTRALLIEGAAQVVAIERDERCVAALGDLAAAFPRRLEIRQADALKTDCRALGPEPRQIVSNLPYNVGTALLIGWLHDLANDPRAYKSLTLMFQKEVADRLVARPRSKSYGRLSVLTQWLCEVSPLFNLPAAAFTPPPKVASTVIRLAPRAEPLAAARIEALERITAAAFGQRRKTLRRSLGSLGENAEKLLAAAEIDGGKRAEELPVEAFCALARALGESR